MKTYLLIGVVVMAVSVASSCKQHDETPEQVAEKYTRATLDFDSKKVQEYSEWKHLPDLFEWYGNWASSNMSDMLAELSKNKLTVKQSSNIIYNDSTVYFEANSCMVDVYIQMSDSTNKLHDELLWQLKLVQHHTGGHWLVYENYGKEIGITREVAEQVALNFMNALIDLDLEKAGEYTSQGFGGSCAWERIEAYALSIINDETKYEESYDLYRLRKYKSEGLVLKVFKTELFDYNQTGRWNGKLIWAVHEDSNGNQHDSGSILLIKENYNWKILGYRF
jgi:hypothetical protein